MTEQLYSVAQLLDMVEDGDGRAWETIEGIIDVMVCDIARHRRFMQERGVEPPGNADVGRHPADQYVGELHAVAEIYPLYPADDPDPSDN